MVDYRGLFIEMIARNITLDEIAQHLNITPDYLTAKLNSADLMTLDEAAEIYELFKLFGSELSFDGLFCDQAVAAE